MLDQWSFRTIENEEREKRHTHESGTTKEERAQLWILPFFTVCGVEEPNRGINSYAKAPSTTSIGFEPLGNR
jgi:hypothetical protein